MSALSPIARSELPRRIVPTTPVVARPRCTSQPHSASFVATSIGGALLLEPDLGMGVDVAADRGQLVETVAHLGDDRHGGSSVG